MKKKLALVLAATMAVSTLFVGCSSGSDEEKETTTKAPAQTTTEENNTTKPQEEDSTAPQETTTEAPSFEAKSFGRETKDQKFWEEFSDYFKYKGDFKVTYEIDVDGGAANWNSFVVVLAKAERDAEGYGEYAVVRPDCWGWGGGDNKSLAGNDIVYTKSDELLFDASRTPSFAATANQSVMKVTVERVGSDVTVTFDIAGDNGDTIQTTAKVTDNFEDEITLFFCADGSYCTITNIE